MTGQVVKAFIGLGGNLGDRAEQIRKALAALQAHSDIHLLAISSLYETEPWGETDQPNFLNAVAAAETQLGEHGLLQALKTIESDHGRRQDSRRWGPRTIDLDLLLYASQRFASPDLILPHPRMHERAFVLIPLLEIEPQAHIPGQGRAAEALEGLSRQEKEGVVRYADLPSAAEFSHE